MAYYRKRSFRKRSAAGAKGKSKYLGRRPPRYRGSKAPRSYVKTKNLAMEISKIGENFIKAGEYRDLSPSPFPSVQNAEMYYTAWNLGHTNILPIQSAGPLEMYNLPSSPTDRYKYVKTMTSQFEIKMDNYIALNELDLFNNTAPVAFTFMLIKPNSKAVVSQPDIANDLWIAPNGESRGIATTDTLSTLNMRSALFNSKKWTCLYKTKFNLSRACVGYDNEAAPGTPGNIPFSGISTNQTSKNSKFIRVRIPTFRKIFYADATTPSSSPKDFADTTIALVYAYNLITGARASGWTVSNTNTLSYNNF